MRKIVAYARGRGIRQFVGDVMAENEPMLKLLKSLGFRFGPADEPGIRRATLDLAA
jgi:acetyltransferase